MVGAKFVLVLPLALLLFTGSAAYAQDFDGERGNVASVEINTTSADTYLQYHGELLVLNLATKALDTYRWGGTSCGARLLSDAQVASLRAAVNEKRTQIVPRYQPGQGPNKCIVGFQLVSGSFLKAVFP